MRAGLDSASPRPEARRAGLRVDLLLLLLAFVTVGPVVQTLGAQAASRLALTAAIWDHHTVDVSDYPLARIDEAFHDGEIRSDKAPGQPLLAVPFYAAFRLAGGHASDQATIHENRALWWVSLWSSVVPFGLLLILLRRAVEPIAPGYGTELALAVGFGTMLFPFGGLLFGHELAALLAFAAWMTARRSARNSPQPPNQIGSSPPAGCTRTTNHIGGLDAAGGRRLLFGAGLLGGAAVAVEYPAALIILGVFAVVAWRHRERALWFVLGTLPAAVVITGYQWLAFGSPLRLSYTQKSGHGTHVPGHGVSLSVLARAFVGDRGLLVVSPLCVLGIGLAIWLVGGPGHLRGDAFVTCIAFASLLAVVARWPNPWGGASPGPRYLIPAFPLIVFPLASRWKEVRRVGLVLPVVGAVFGALALSTSPYVNVSARSAPRIWFDWLLHGPHADTLYTMAIGDAGWLLHLAVVAIVAVALWRADRRLRVGTRDQVAVPS